MPSGIENIPSKPENPIETQVCNIFAKEKFRKILKFRKKFEIFFVDPKTSDLAILQNFDAIEKKLCRIRNQRSEINKVALVYDKVYLC